MDELAAAAEMVSREDRIYRSVAEAMPDVVYLLDGDREFSFADLYVRGTVSDVKAGRSFSWTEDDDEEVRIEHDFNDPLSLASSIHVVVDVKYAIADDPSAVAPASITFGLGLDTPVDLEAARKELVELGEIVLLLYEPSPVYDYVDDVWAVLEDGTFIGVVGRSGRLDFPALDPGDADDLLPSGLTVADLETSDPPGPFRLTTVDEVLTRVDEG